MTTLSAEIDKATILEYMQYFNYIAQTEPQNLSRATKVAGLEVCKSLKARTRKSPKKIPAKEYLATTKAVPMPHYITWKKGKGPVSPPLHRWMLVKKRGTPAEHTGYYFVYSHERFKRRMGMKNGNWQGIVRRVPDLTAEKRELIKNYGGIFHTGLAKRSWGWAAQGVYNGMTNDVSFKLRHRDKRDPRREVSGETRTTSNAVNTTTEVNIANRLDYITAAMYPGAVNDAAQAALQSLAFKFDRNFPKPDKPRKFTHSHVLSLITADLMGQGRNGAGR